MLAMRPCTCNARADGGCLADHAFLDKLEDDRNGRPFCILFAPVAGSESAGTMPETVYSNIPRGYFLNRKVMDLCFCAAGDRSGGG